MTASKKLIQASAGNVAGGDFYPYTVDNSARFDGASYLAKTFTTPTDTKKYTISVWLKITDLNKTLPVIFSAVGVPGSWEEYIGPYLNVFRLYNGGTGISVVDSAKRRDSSSWYHLHIKVDTTQATASNRMVMTVNGTPITVASSSYPSQNASTTMNSAVAHRIGYFVAIGGDYYFEGYMADFVFVDGTAYSATDFGEFKNGVWVPKDPSGLTFGTNGFWLDFSNSAALGTDVSGNGNNFTSSGLTSSDQMPDTPTNNFATWNPLLKGISQTGVSTSDGNMLASYTGSAGSGYWPSFSTMTLPKNGKVYFEMCLESVYNGALIMGIMSKEDAEKYAAGTQSPTLGNLGYWSIHDGSAYAWGGNGQPDYLTLGLVTNAGIAGGVVGFAIDLDAGKGWIRVNGTWILSGDPANGTNPIGSDIHTGNGASASGEYVIWNSGYISLNAYSRSILNCGQDSTFSGRKTAGNYADENGIGDFLYSVPSGFLALCTANLPEPTIGPNSDILTSEVFAPILYTGNGTSQSISTLDFQPDFTWIKNRDAADNHMLFDAARGATKYLSSNTTSGENTDAQSLSSFNSNGFSVGNNVQVNTNAEDYVAWNWKANGSGVTNNDGSVTSTVSVNQDAGISIATFNVGTGTVDKTYGHGLGTSPAFVLMKARNTAATQWWVWHKSFPNPNNYLYLGQPFGLLGPDANIWGNSGFTSTTCGFRSNYTFVVSDDIVTYNFAEVDGFSSFGSYTGNGSADGPFIYTGFRPAFVMVKSSSAATSWFIMDSTRDTKNAVVRRLSPDLSQIETVDSALFDFTSNGFKLRYAGGAINTSSATYIYMAFAEMPFKYSVGR